MTARTISTRTLWILVSVAGLIAGDPGVATSGVKPDVMANSLEGTTWSGPDSDGEQTAWTFESGGILSYKTPNGSYRNGTWTQSGKSVHFETNKYYAQWVGEINGNTMQGQAWNKTKKRWIWKVTKEE